MKIRKENKEERIKSTSFTRLALFSIFFFLCSFKLSAQDSIPAPTDLTEEKELKFQQFFFKALSEKSITNYQKAIENLEECNQILPNDVAVFFEFSKNYLLKNDTFLAKEYIDRALDKEPNNIWMLAHLVEIYRKDKNYTEAIIAQKQIVRIDASRKTDLVYLYLSNKEFDKAITLLKDIKEERGLTTILQRIENGLATRKNQLVATNEIDNSFVGLSKQFESKKSFQTLQKIFDILEKEKNFSQLNEYSSKGIALFPAQPLVYLIKGKSLNAKKNFNEALTILKNGIDFVIEDKMEADFYSQMAKAYAGNGNASEAKKYKDLAKKLKS